MSAPQALRFVREHGIVLVSARGPVPRLTEAIAGEPIKGSWWSHPRGREIFRVLGSVQDSDEVLSCRLIDGKLTLVHARLWPALVRLADRFAPERIARVREVHTASGRHETRETPYPRWVPAAVKMRAREMTEENAERAFGIAARAS